MAYAGSELSKFLLAAVCLVALSPAPASAFDCAPTECSVISSCAEARYKLYVCGHGERDSDNDGIPCENLCGKDTATFHARSVAQWPKALPFIETPKAKVLDVVPEAQASPVPPRAFACAGKRTCRQMDSCEEAQFYLRSCGVTSLDRDHDGRACNSLCGGP
jgi:hypothetical protein